MAGLRGIGLGEGGEARERSGVVEPEIFLDTLVVG